MRSYGSRRILFGLMICPRVKVLPSGPPGVEVARRCWAGLYSHVSVGRPPYLDFGQRLSGLLKSRQWSPLLEWRGSPNDLCIAFGVILFLPWGRVFVHSGSALWSCPVKSKLSNILSLFFPISFSVQTGSFPTGVAE